MRENLYEWQSACQKLACKYDFFFLFKKKAAKKVFWCHIAAFNANSLFLWEKKLPSWEIENKSCIMPKKHASKFSLHFLRNKVSRLSFYSFISLCLRGSFRETSRDIHVECSKQSKWNFFLCVWAERTILGSANSALKFKYEI